MNLTFQPTMLGFEFRIGKQYAMIVHEDMCVIHYQIDQKVRWMNKPVFWDRLGKRPNGENYLGKSTPRPKQ